MSPNDRREGGDITAADMVLPDQPPSEIERFYEDSTVLVTGATGLLGKLLLEKLLRTCAVRRVYVLVRDKGGEDKRRRFEGIFEAFEGLRRSGGRVRMVGGDCGLPGLGLGEEDAEALATEVDCVFHCAAAGGPLKEAARVNVGATRDLLAIAGRMRRLRAFVHVSTAFSHCPREEIDEKFYDTKIKADDVLTMVDRLDDDLLAAMAPKILDGWPNACLFTKALAEEIVRTKSAGLPIAVVRPSLVISTAKEPVAGWTDNANGPTGLSVAVSLGVVHALRCRRQNVVDVVPADYVVNVLLASAWDLGTKSNDPSQSSIDGVPIYNYVSGVQNPITWSDYLRLVMKNAAEVPSPKLVWYPFIETSSGEIWHSICAFLFHRLPASGREAREKLRGDVEYFALREWRFKDDNVRALWRKMRGLDREVFEFNVASLDWDAYMYTCVRGGRVYLLKDPLETIPQGHIKRRKLMVAHYSAVALVVILLLVLLRLLFVSLK